MKTILKNIMFLSALALSLGGVACDDKGQDINYNINPGNDLYLPQSGAVVDLSKVKSLSFEWASSVAEDNGYVAYDVLFDLENGDFSDPVAVKPSQLSGLKTNLTITAKEMNGLMKAAGVGRAETGTIKWTVRASKGLFGSVYSKVNTLVVTRMNSMEPVPTAVTLKGAAMEDPNGIQMVPSAGIDKGRPDPAVFECFTKLTAGEFSIVDDLGRCYNFAEGNELKYTDEVETPTTLPDGAGIYWIKADFDGMTWSAVKVFKVELYAAQWGSKGMQVVRAPLTYDGKGVWKVLDYDNKNSLDDGKPGDSRHRFDMTLGDGSMLYLGTEANLGAEYSVEYMKVNFYTKATIGSPDWDKTYHFLTADCGRPLDCYLYLNGDNPAKRWWHEYIFK